MSPHRILVVDDDADIRDALQGLLEAEGYRVATAANGVEALDDLRAHAADTSVVLLDLMMPVMSGWEFCEKRLSEPALVKIPVVVLSAVSKLNQGACPGAAAYLAKPIDVDRLLSTLTQYLEVPLRAD